MIPSPFDAFGSASKPGTRGNRNRLPLALRVRVARVSSSPANRDPSFLCDCVPLGAPITTGAEGNLLRDVLILQPFVGSLDSRTTSPTGIIGLPQVGSQGLVVYDGSRWVLAAYYTGPVYSPLEQGIEDDDRSMTMNPGIEKAVSRLVSQLGWDIDDWAFALAPGDVLLGAGASRIKATQAGAIIGCGPTAMAIYKPSGEVLERFVERTVRGVGYWLRHQVDLGPLETAAAAALAETSGFREQVAPPPGAFTYRAEVVDCGVLPRQLRPILVRQTGHVSRGAVARGLSAVQETTLSAEAAAEAATNDHVVSRVAVVQPLIPDNPSSLPELSTGLAVCRYDKQIDADGSFRERAGNLASAPGVESPAGSSLDLAVEFDAATGAYTIRAGPTGGAAVVLRLSGRDGRASLIATGPVDVVSDAPVAVTAPEVSITASKIHLTGEVAVAGSLKVTGPLNANGVVFNSHIHTYVDDGSPRPTTPPT